MADPIRSGESIKNNAVARQTASNPPIDSKGVFRGSANLNRGAFYPSAGREASPKAGEIAALLAQQIKLLALELVGTKPTSGNGHEMRFRRHGSLAVEIAGPKAGSWYDHEAVQGGDALELVVHLRGCSKRDALAWARVWLGISSATGAAAPPPRHPTPAARQEARPKSNTLDLAHRLWKEGQPAKASPVEQYLASRGLWLPADAPLRFHPACPRGRGGERLPAMVALMTDPVTGEACGVHRTFLAPDGRGKAPGLAKMMAGAAGVVRLVPDEEVSLGLGIAEGIETALAVAQFCGWAPVWAALSAGGITRFPILRGVECLTICADGDVAGMGAARACAERWRDAGCEASILEAPAGEDFLDAAGRAA
ncbi:toprim domain-containing protein [Roseomonas mucosa]|uniref:DUF7146 domain-containing protein n=1 Tax=Roseomonas mucosa TaxID=207340 RepID=UPI00384CFD6D